MTQHREEGGPPGLRAMGWSFLRGIGAEVRGEGRKVTAEPGFEGRAGRKERRSRGLEGLEEETQGGPVGQGPVRGWRWGCEYSLRNYNRNRNMVRASRGEGGITLSAVGG